MKRNHMTALLLGIILLLPVFQLNVFAAEEQNIVYTEFISGNFNHAGDGTLASPYNLFEDAMNAVADGGTIYILGRGAFINDIDSVSPLRITKNVTITAAPGVSVRPRFVVRTAGIVLGANVTFHKIELSFESGFRAVICANGHTLTLNDVSYDTHARKIHLAGGGMFYKNGVSASPETGAHSRIIVTGKESLFGNIYAGSINGSFDKAVDITVENISGRTMGTVYASGAAEVYYDSDNFLDPENEPKPPEMNPYDYPVRGKVSIELRNTGIGAINGATGGAENASLSVSTQNLYSCILANIHSLEVKKGVFAPTDMEDGINISVQQGATLDMSALMNYTANDFTGGGTLILNYEDCLTVRGNCAGETEFRTYGGSQYHSGLAVYDHLYIKTSAGDGTFLFSPYPLQNDMILGKHSDGWRTSVQSAAASTVLAEFDLETNLLLIPVAQVNGTDGAVPPTLQISSTYTEDTPPELQYIEFVPFEYTVTYNGKTYSTPSDDIGGYYEGNIKELNLNFYLAEDSITISRFSTVYDDFGMIAVGTYDIAITAPTATGNMTRSLRLVVTEDAAAGSQPTELHITTPAQEVADGDSINLSAAVTDAAAQQGVRAGNITLYINGQPYSAPKTPDSSGAVSWKDIAVTRENGFKTGTNLLTAVYSGTDVYASSKTEITITVNRTDMFEISEQNGKVDMAFTNLSGKEIHNALLIMGVYDRGALQKTAVAKNGVTIDQEETQSFRFDMSGTRFDSIQGFLWESIETMAPLAKNTVVSVED